MTAPIRVLIVDDDALVRSALSYMLSGAEGIQVVGEGGVGEAAVNAVTAHSPDVVLMDIRMPRVDGLGDAAAPGRRADHRADHLRRRRYVLQALRAGASVPAGPLHRSSRRSAARRRGCGPPPPCPAVDRCDRDRPTIASGAGSRAAAGSVTGAGGRDRDRAG